MTAGRNALSESYQIFVNVGGAVFSFAYTSVQLIQHEIKMMPFI